MTTAMMITVAIELPSRKRSCYINTLFERVEGYSERVYKHKLPSLSLRPPMIPVHHMGSPTSSTQRHVESDLSYNKSDDDEEKKKDTQDWSMPHLGSHHGSNVFRATYVLSTCTGSHLMQWAGT
jgi:hypothetical protein